MSETTVSQDDSTIHLEAARTEMRAMVGNLTRVENGVLQVQTIRGDWMDVSGREVEQVINLARAWVYEFKTLEEPPAKETVRWAILFARTSAELRKARAQQRTYKDKVATALLSAYESHKSHIELSDLLEFMEGIDLDVPTMKVKATVKVWRYQVVEVEVESNSSGDDLETELVEAAEEEAGDWGDVPDGYYDNQRAEVQEQEVVGLAD